LLFREGGEIYGEVDGGGHYFVGGLFCGLENQWIRGVDYFTMKAGGRLQLWWPSWSLSRVWEQVWELGSWEHVGDGLMHK
jgi:hypothetical protein